jgi:hypothetical protein
MGSGMLGPPAHVSRTVRDRAPAWQVFEVDPRIEDATSAQLGYRARERSCRAASIDEPAQVLVRPKRVDVGLAGRPFDGMWDHSPLSSDPLGPARAPAVGMIFDAQFASCDSLVVQNAGPFTMGTAYGGVRAATLDDARGGI